MGSFDDHLAPRAGETVLGDRFLLVEDPDRYSGERLTHHDASAGMRVRHRLAVAAIGHQALLRHEPMTDIAGVISGLTVQRHHPFVRKAHKRDFARGRMHTQVGLAAPGQRLPVQVLKRSERDPWPEGRLDVGDGGLDLALGLWSIGPADPGNEAVVAGEVQYLRMKAGLAINPVQHHCLHVDGQHRLRHALEELQRMDNTVQQRLRIVALGKLHILHLRPAQCQSETVKTLAGPVAEVAQVHLRLFARRSLKTNERSLLALAPPRPHHLLHLSLAAGITSLLDLGEQAGCVLNAQPPNVPAGRSERDRPSSSSPAAHTPAAPPSNTSGPFCDQGSADGRSR